MHIALIHSKYEDVDEMSVDLNPKGPQQMSDTILNIRAALEAGGHSVTPVLADNHFLSALEKIPTPDLLFNLSSGISDKRAQANVVGMLEMTGIPMLGSGLATHVVGLHKEITKSILSAHSIRTARFQLIGHATEEIRPDFTFPLMVKPEHEGSGIGVTETSKVDSAERLREVIKEKLSVHKQVLLVEEFLPGREFTVGVMGNRSLEILPIKETIFHKDGPQILTNLEKVGSENTEVIPAQLSSELKEEIETMAARTYRVLRCRDFARVDIRLDAKGHPHVIELNTYPGLGKDFSYFPQLARAAGYTYDALINRLVAIATEPKGFI